MTENLNLTTPCSLPLQRDLLRPDGRKERRLDGWLASSWKNSRLTTLKKLISNMHRDMTTPWPRHGARPSDSEYVIEDGLLFHKCRDKTGEDLLQLVLPVSEREKTIRVAKPLAGHTGRRKTAQKCEHFIWPGLNKDVREACRSCGQCQMAAQVDRQKAPLMPLPVVDHAAI